MENSGKDYAPQVFLEKAATPLGVRAYNGQGKSRGLLQDPLGPPEWKTHG